MTASHCRAVLLALLAVVGGVTADEPRRPGFEQHYGSIKTLDTKTGTLTLALIGDDRRDVDYNLRRDTTVTLDGKAGKLADLKVGMVVRVEYTKDNQEIATIRAEGRSVRGRIVNVNAAAGTVTLAGERPLTPVVVGQDVAVQLEGKPAKLDDLKPGMTVNLKYASSNDRVATIEVLPPRPPAVRGAFKTYDAKTRQLVVAVRQEGGAASALTVTLDDEAPVLQGRLAVKPEELKPGTEITVTLSADRQVAKKVQLVVGDREK